MPKSLDLFARFARNANKCKKKNNICKYEEPVFLIVITQVVLQTLHTFTLIHNK